MIAAKELMDGLSVALLTGDTTLTVDQAWEHVKVLLPDRPSEASREGRPST